jgi:hypothetical protein
MRGGFMVVVVYFWEKAVFMRSKSGRGGREKANPADFEPIDGRVPVNF